MAPHFGPNVQGHENYDKAVRSEQGGGNVFGTRVRSAIPDSGPTNAAKRVSEFGVAVTQHAKGTDAQGNETDTVSIDDLRNILTENPTFFDSLYEAELAREDGPRPDALQIFYEVERGIKGQMRADVMQEIRGLLGQKAIDADARANQAAVQAQVQADIATRTEENKLLADADRVKALKDRAENVKAVKDAQESGDVGVQVGFTTEAQANRIASDAGITLPGQEHATGSLPGGQGTPAKPAGAVQPATQQPGSGSPSGAQSSAGGLRPHTGAASEESSSQDEGEQDFESMKKDELEAYLGEDAENVKGSGADGAVVKADLVKAAKKKAKKSGSK